MKLLFENFRKFLNESLTDSESEFSNKLKTFNGEEKNNSHVTAVYKGFGRCTFMKYLKGKNREHKRWDFQRGSDRGRGRYSFDEWKKLKLDVIERGIQNAVFIVVDWDGDRIIGRVYEGNHRIRLGCQTDQPIPVEIRFFGKSEEFVNEDNFDFDIYRLVRYGLSQGRGMH